MDHSEARKRRDLLAASKLYSDIDRLPARPADAVKRETILRDIYQSEQTYCASLQSLVSTFVHPIQLDSSILKKVKKETIFSNVEEIMNLHTPFLYELEEIIREKTYDKIGYVLARNASYFSVYKEYCCNSDDAIDCLHDCLDNYSKFANFVQSKGEDLEKLLLLPVRRIEEYRDLFEDMVNSTPVTDSDLEDCKKALSRIETVDNHIKDFFKEKHNKEKLHQIQQNLTGKGCPKIVEPDRIFIREGELMKMCRRTPKKRYFFLFSDMLIYSTIDKETENGNTYNFHRAIDVDQMKVEEAPSSEGMENSFSILSNQKSFAVSAETPKLKRKWMQDIRTATGRFEQPDDDDTAPVWVPDKLVKTCMHCNSKFTAIHRRHHCRKCGDLVCGSCSGKKFKLPNIGKLCRVCDDCFNELSGLAPPKAKSEPIRPKIEPTPNTNIPPPKKPVNPIPQKELPIKPIPQKEKEIQPIEETSKSSIDNKEKFASQNDIPVQNTKKSKKRSKDTQESTNRRQPREQRPKKRKKRSAAAEAPTPASEEKIVTKPRSKTVSIETTINRSLHSIPTKKLPPIPPPKVGLDNDVNPEQGRLKDIPTQAPPRPPEFSAPNPNELDYQNKKPLPSLPSRAAPSPPSDNDAPPPRPTSAKPGSITYESIFGTNV